jgi:hypothetical protein
VAGEEFASALVRFEIDDRQFQDGLKRVEAAARATAANADKAFRDVGKSTPGGPAGSAPVDTGGLKKATDATAGLGKALGGLTGPAGRAAGQVAGVAAGAVGLSTGVGVAVVAAQLLVNQLEDMSRKAGEAIEAEGKLQHAFNTADSGPARAELSKFAQERERVAAAARAAIEDPASIKGLVGLKAVVFNDLDELGKRAEKARAQLKVLAQTFELPRAQAQADQEALGATAARLKFEQEGARTGEDILRNLDARVVSIRQAADLEARLLLLKAAEDELAARGNGEDESVIAARRKIVNDRIATIRSISETQVSVETAAAKKGAAEVEAVAAEHEAKIAAIRAQGVADGLKAGQALADAQRALADDRAKFEGRALEGLGQFQADRRENIERQIGATLLALNEDLSSKRRALEARLDGARGQDAERLQAQLTEVVAQGEAARTKALQDATVQRIALEQKEAQERQEQARRALAQAELDLRRAKLAGTATINDEIANLRAAASNGDLDAETRITKAEQVKERLAQVDQQYFALRRTLGQATFVDEVHRQTEIVESYRRGTQARLDAETDLAAKVKQLREQAASAGESLLQKAAGRLQARGIGEATLQDLQQEVADLKREANEALAGLRTGGAVDLGSLSENFSTARQSAQLKDLGVTATQATNTAVGNALAQLSAAPRPPASIFSTDAAQAENATASVSRIADSYAKAFDGVLKGTDDFMAAFIGKIDSGNSVVADALFETFMTKVTRRLQDEARRQ